MSRDLLKESDFRALYAPLAAGEAGESRTFSSLTRRVQQLEARLRDASQEEAARLCAAVDESREAARVEARAEHEDALRSLRAVAAELGRVARSELEIAQEDLIALATAIAGKIVHREIRSDDRFAERMVRRCLRKIVHKAPVRIRVNPQDYAGVAAAEPGFASEAGVGEITIVEDRRVERGGCIVETPDFVVDATLRSQLAAAHSALAGEAG